MAEALAARGYSVSVLTTGTIGSEMVIDMVNGLTIYRVGLKNSYWHYEKPRGRLKRLLWHLRDIYNWGMKQDVEKVVEKEKPDIVICHNMAGFSVSAWDVLKRHSLPIIEVLHDQYMRCPNSNASKRGIPCKGQCIVCRMMRIPHRWMSARVDAVVGVSYFVLNSLTALGYFGKSRQYVIHNARSIAEPVSYLKWNGKEPLRIGYIGTLSKVKGVEWLIRSFIKMDINATLIIAGRGATPEYEQYLKELASSDSRIHFSGYAKSSEHYAQVHLSVIPSLWPDTFPTVAFESCAYHVPVIATNLGGLPEIINNAVNGLIVDISAPNSLQNAILRLYNDRLLLCSMAENARDAVKEMIDVKGWIDKYVEIIEKV